MIPVTDFVLHAGEPAPALDLFAFDGPPDADALEGQFALHQERDGEHRFVRDPLGVVKRFFAVGPEGRVTSSNRLADLLAHHPLEAVWSVPSGHWISLDPGRRRFRLERWARIDWLDAAPDDEAALSACLPGIHAALTTTFRRLARLVAGRPLYVTLSGGLDSTTVAVLAREHLGPFEGLTFARADAGRAEHRGDLHHAEQVARQLGVPHHVVTVPDDALVESLDFVLVEGQDWRDFNVHCGMVNAALAAHLQEVHGEGPRPVVLTGDTMNELMADYTPVRHGGREYYGLPRLSPAKLRRHLVNGLDTGDREVGIFHARGADVLQPYAWCARAYARFPGGLVGQPGAKERIVRPLLGDRIPESVYRRPKVRAQIGSEEGGGGTLATLVERGIHGEALAERFARLLGLERGDLRRLVRAGFYRFPTRFPEPAG